MERSRVGSFASVTAETQASTTRMRGGRAKSDVLQICARVGQRGPQSGACTMHCDGGSLKAWRTSRFALPTCSGCFLLDMKDRRDARFSSPRTRRRTTQYGDASKASIGTISLHQLVFENRGRPRSLGSLRATGSLHEGRRRRPRQTTRSDRRSARARKSVTTAVADWRVECHTDRFVAVNSGSRHSAA